MALTATQKAAVRHWLGWSARFHQYDSRLEQAMEALATEPEHEARITNVIGGTPPGLLAILEDIDVKIRSAYSRLKAIKVGTIELYALHVEIKGLRSEGRRYVGQLAAELGVEVRHNMFGSGTPKSFAGFGGNYFGV